MKEKLNRFNELLFTNAFVAATASALSVYCFFAGRFSRVIVAIPEFPDGISTAFASIIAPTDDIPSMLFRSLSMMFVFTAFASACGFFLARFHLKQVEMDCRLGTLRVLASRYRAFMATLTVVLLLGVVGFYLCGNVLAVTIDRAGSVHKNLVLADRWLKHYVWIVFALHGLYCLAIQLRLARSNQIALRK